MTLAGIVWWIKALALVSFGVPAAVVVGFCCALLVGAMAIGASALVGFLAMSAIDWVLCRLYGL